MRMPGRYQATVRIIVPNFGGKEGENFPMWDFTDPATAFSRSWRRPGNPANAASGSGPKPVKRRACGAWWKSSASCPRGFLCGCASSAARPLSFSHDTSRALRRGRRMPCTFSTGWKHVKPVRPYRSLQEFATKQHWLGLYPADKWPCLACSGRGWNYDPQDPPCPVEGNRDRRTSPAPPAEAPAKGRRKPAAKPTKRQSPGSAKKPKRVRKARQSPAASTARSSRQRKSKPSGS